MRAGAWPSGSGSPGWGDIYTSVEALRGRQPHRGGGGSRRWLGGVPTMADHEPRTACPRGATTLRGKLQERPWSRIPTRDGRPASGCRPCLAGNTPWIVCKGEARVNGGECRQHSLLFWILCCLLRPGGMTLCCQLCPGRLDL